MKYLFLLSLLASLSACQSQEIANTSNQALDKVSYSGHDVCDLSCELTRQELDRIQDQGRWAREIGDAERRGRDEERRRNGGFPLLAPETHTALYAKVGKKYGISARSAALLVNTLVDLSAGDTDALKNLGLDEKILARAAGEGHLSSHELATMSARLGVSSAKGAELVEKLLGR